MSKRQLVIAEAMEWKGTKFVHRQRTKKWAADCAGFVAEVYERTGVLPRIELPEYSVDWFQHTDRELYLETILRYCVKTDRPETGNIAMFRLGKVEGGHAGIVTKWPFILAAWPPARCVAEIDASHEPHFKGRLTGFYDPFGYQE